MDVPDIYALVFQNLRLLCLIHPESQDVKPVLKQDMFKVPDVKAFQHVMNFLLNIVIPEEWKKLAVWPVFDRKTEYQFRLAVKKALMEVNKVYASENLPVARSAILTNAGGKDFAVFLFRLLTFILHKSLMDKFGLSDLLYTPLPSENFYLEKAKLATFRELAESTWQKVVDNSMGLSAATERDIDMKLKCKKEDIKREEHHLFKLVQTLPLPEESKQALLDPNSFYVETEELKERMKKTHESMAFLKQVGNEISQCRQIMESSMENNVTGTCISIPTANKMMETVSQAVLDEEPPTLSTLLQKTNEQLNEIADGIPTNRVSDLSVVLYRTRELRTAFEDLEKKVNGTFAELETKLEELKHDYSAMQNGEFDTDGSEKLKYSSDTPELNFYRRMSSAGNNRGAFFDTPKSGLNKKHPEGKEVFKPRFDSELLLSPSLNSSMDSFADLDIKYRSEEMHQNIGFSMPQTNRFVPYSERKFKPQATNLSLLTSSLLKSSSKAYMGNKALSTICNKKAYIGIQRDNGGRHLGAVSKALFTKDVSNSTPENSPKPLSPSAGSEGSLWDSAGDIKENALDLYSSTSMQSEITSPSAILSSTKLEESEKDQAKKKKPRKSLEALIARYKKVVHASCTLQTPKAEL